MCLLVLCLLNRLPQNTLCVVGHHPKTAGDTDGELQRHLSECLCTVTELCTISAQSMLHTHFHMHDNRSDQSHTHKITWVFCVNEGSRAEFVYHPYMGNKQCTLHSGEKGMEVSLYTLLSRGLCFSGVNFVSVYLSLVSTQCNRTHLVVISISVTFY